MTPCGIVASETYGQPCHLDAGHFGEHEPDFYPDEPPPDRDADGRTPAERAALDRWARRNDEGAGLPDDDQDPDGDFLR